MNRNEYRVETLREVWSERYECVEIGPDRDGLLLVEVRYKAADGKPGPCMAYATAQARLVARAMLACADEIDAAANEHN